MLKYFLYSADVHEKHDSCVKKLLYKAEHSQASIEQISGQFRQRGVLGGWTQNTVLPKLLFALRSASSVSRRLPRSPGCHGFFMMPMIFLEFTIWCKCSQKGTVRCFKQRWDSSRSLSPPPPPCWTIDKDSVQILGRS